MNSVYKRYIFIAALIALICAGVILNFAVRITDEIDRVNAYAAENGNLKNFDFGMLSCYIEDTETDKEGRITESMVYPDFTSVMHQCIRNDGSGIWAPMLAIMIVLLYKHERSSATADFCAVLPVKSRNKFIVKLLCAAAVVAAMVLANLVSIYMFNARVDACNATCQILNMDSIYPIELDLKNIVVIPFLSKMTTAAFMLFLAECTGRAYLPPCIAVLAVYALAGAFGGFYNYLDFYFNIKTSLNLFRAIALNYSGYVENYGWWVSLCGTLIFSLWGLFLSGRGDMSRRGRVFRFRWTERLTMACIVVCAALCSFEVMYLFEFNYSVSAGAAAVIMAVVGVTAYFVSKRVILLLGR